MKKWANKKRRHVEFQVGDLDGVCFFYLILNITFFEFNAE